MFIVPKALLISNAIVNVRIAGAIWLNHFATVLFNVCNAVIVECCVLNPCCVDGMACYVRKKALLQCACNYWEEGYGPVLGALVYVFVGFWDGDNVIQLPYVWYYVLVKSSFKHARKKCELKRAYVF